MRRQHQYALLFALVLTLTTSLVGAGWAVNNPYVSTISCPDWPYSNQLTALVTTNGDGSYHYEYTLEFLETALDEPLVDFSVGNPDNLPFRNPGCTYSFTMATNSTDSVYWYVDYGAALAGQTVKFWFDSDYTYCVQDVTVWAGLPSNGFTLGMVAPEPGTFAAMAVGLLGLVPMLRRRR